MPPDSPSKVTLQTLQQLQVDFDRERGFDFAGADVSDDDRKMFSGLALAGEVGELANALKKAQRAAWLGDDPAPHIRRAVEETGDVLAYLLKISSTLGVDLTEVYLTTMSDNCFRFPPRSVTPGGQLLAIAGPTGSGKTTIARALSGEHVTFIEDVATNPHLEALLTNSATFDAFANQRWFLTQVERFVDSADSLRTVVFDQDPAAIVRVYARMFRDDSRLETDAYHSLMIDLLRLEGRLSRWGAGRATVFLDAPAAILRERARLRGDRVVPPEDWFERVRVYFLDLHAQVPSALVIATDHVSVADTLALVRNSLRPA